MAEADCWCIQVNACNKETCEMITILRVNKCGIGISSIFDTVFWYLPIFLMVLQYWVPSNVPLLEHEKIGFDVTLQSQLYFEIGF